MNRFSNRLRAWGVRLAFASIFVFLWAQFAGIHMHGHDGESGAHIHATQAPGHAHVEHQGLADEVDLMPVGLAKLVFGADMLALVAILLLFLTRIMQCVAQPYRARCAPPGPPPHLIPPLRAPPA